MAALPLDGASEDLVRDAALLLAQMMLLEAPGEYVYDTVEEKRLVLGDGGRSGNCEYCVDAADRGWIADDDVFEGPMGDEDGPPLHPNAVFSGSTFSSYDRLNRMVSAKYDGMAVQLNAGKYGTTIGPNHPMLTARGLVQAKFLQVGDQLVYDKRVLDVFAGCETSNLDQIHPVQDVFAAIKPSCRNTRVSASSVYFHGDVVSGNVEIQIVLPDRKLLHEMDSGGLQFLRKDDLVIPDVHLSEVAAIRSFNHQLERFLLSSSSGVSSGNVQHYGLLTIEAIRQIEIQTRAFDASTDSGWYCSDGFVVSNCTCSLEYRTRRFRVAA